ncbi:MAG: type I DNA topoisomerase [Oscillospiraceae bacterium]|nr:type I DNA topoisomerase [Oscillospiraceae bacterium]
MVKNLVIVESPAKAKTIKKYLGNGFNVIASMGHVRDLPAKRLCVDIKDNFKPKYAIIKGKEEIVREIKSESAKSNKVFLAADPDREGEAISWHLAHILGLDPEEKNRITFNEITKTGIKNGISSPRTLNSDLINAQQARRILDRLVGYKLSPFLCQKLQKGLSAGRVQSVALRIIVDRENQIRAFIPQEYWTIIASLTVSGGGNKVFQAQFYGKEKEIKLKTQAQVEKILEDLEGAQYVVNSVKKGKRNKNPAPPFITSTMQQEASRKLNFSAKKTMKTAQELYEGVEVEGIGAVGLITYMRTDSLRISQEAAKETSDFIEKKWGKDYLPSVPRRFKVKAGSQDAHEAIRPTMPSFDPERVKISLTSDQFKLYKLIWARFVASQMAVCVQNTVKVELSAAGYIFRASGCSVLFDGFTVLYTESKDEKESDEKMLPPLKEGDVCKLKKIENAQHFTEPPPRYTEASLIKALEEHRIGRPSTYAVTISTILYREYVVKEGKIFRPTELGEAVNGIMVSYFPKIVDIGFTASMEEELDSIESGNMLWTETLGNFYSGFEKTLEDAKEKTKDLKIHLKENETDIICEKCGRPMVVKHGRFGKFIGCSGFPECENIKKFVKKVGVKCPKCGAEVVKKASKKGRAFYGCERFPECDYAAWNQPTNEICPSCGRMLYKNTKKIFCAEPDCKYSRNL